MATNEELQYNITSKAQLAALQRAISAMGDMVDAVDDMADETGILDKKVEGLNDELKDTIKFGERMKGALGGIGKIAGRIGSGVAGIAGVISGAVLITQNWALNVEKLSDQFSIGLDEAAALATSWERVGLSAEKGASLFSGLQGRLIGEIEAQKEAQKELQVIQAQRAGVVQEVADAEIAFHKTIAELELERASLDEGNIAERKKRANDEIEDLRTEYTRFIQDQEDLEREETATFEKIWEDRARKFEESSEKLRGKFAEDSRKSRNVREFLGVKKNFQEQRQLLIDNLNENKEEQKNSNEKTVKDREQANAREFELMEEKSAAIAKTSNEDVAKMEEANQEAVVNLNARIADETAAYADRTANFDEELGALREAEEETAKAGGDLAFVMEELGIKVFDAQGKMRPFNDIIWDVQNALQNMEEGGRKAALIADLGLEDAAPWINRGAKEIESLRFAQEKGLLVTEANIDAIHKQRQALIDARLSAIGFANSLGLTEKANTAIVAGMTATQKAIIIAKDLWGQLKIIVSLLWDKFLEGLEASREALKTFGAFGSEVFGDIKEGLGFGKTGVFTKTANLLGFAQGTRSVPGTKPQLAVVEPGEEIRTRADVIAGIGGSGGRGDLVVNINAPVFGVEDIDRHINNAMLRYDQGAFAGA